MLALSRRSHDAYDIAIEARGDRLAAQVWPALPLFRHHGDARVGLSAPAYTELEEALAMGQDLQKAVSAAQDVGQNSHDRPTWGLTRRSNMSTVEPQLRACGGWPLSSRTSSFRSNDGKRPVLRCL